MASDEKNFPKCFINFINFQEETAVETGKASKGEKTKQSGEEDDLEFKPDRVSRLGGYLAMPVC